MKFIPLVWSSLWRKPVRASFTLASTAIAFLLFGTLNGVTQGMDDLANQLSLDRLRVQSRSSMMEMLPISYGDEIGRVAGVTNVTSIAAFPSYFQDPKHAITSAALGGDNPLLALPAQVHLSEQEGQEFLRNRVGALVGARLAKEYGWKLGDRVTLISTLWANRSTGQAWSFDIAGIYEWEGQPELAREFYFNYKYLNEGRLMGRDTANMYAVRVDSAAKPAVVAQAIDRLFENSAHPTITQTDREWLQSQMKKIGDVQFLVRGIVGASIFALLFLVCNIMMQSVRERTNELGVLKALGFRDRKVLILVAAEAGLLSLPGALIGLGLAWVAFPALSNILRSPIMMSPEVLLIGAAVALVVATFSAFLPGWRATELSIVDALGRR